MIIDGLLLFSSAQNLTTSNIASTNVLDLLNARDMGIGDNPALKVACYVTTAFTSTDSATLTIQLQGSTDNVTFSTYAQSRAYTAGELIANAKLAPLDWVPKPGALDLPRYLALNYAMGALHFTPGAVTSMLVLDRQDWLSYPAGINISN